jgi:hypothetical protein
VKPEVTATAQALESAMANPATQQQRPPHDPASKRRAQMALDAKASAATWIRVPAGAIED